MLLKEWVPQEKDKAMWNKLTTEYFEPCRLVDEYNEPHPKESTTTSQPSARAVIPDAQSPSVRITTEP